MEPHKFLPGLMTQNPAVFLLNWTKAAVFISIICPAQQTGCWALIDALYQWEHIIYHIRHCFIYSTSSNALQLNIAIDGVYISEVKNNDNFLFFNPKE